MGRSGGGPYAVACAYALHREELKATGATAGMGPVKGGIKDMMLASRDLMQGIRYAPGLVERFVNYFVGKTFRSPVPEVLLNAMKKQLKWLPRKEYEGLEREPGELEKATKVLQAHFRQGSADFVTDSRVFAED